MYLLFLKRRVGFIDMQQLLGLTPGNLDHHIRKLDELNLVSIHRVLSWRPLVIIEITQRGIGIFRDYIHKLKALLEEIPDTMLQETGV
jgi:DNA-binding MarR family transcriptional regulator